MLLVVAIVLGLAWVVGLIAWWARRSRSILAWFDMIAALAAGFGALLICWEAPYLQWIVGYVLFVIASTWALLLVNRAEPVRS